MVVNNNFFQGATLRSGDVTLSAGLHQITLAFYEGGGGAGGLFEWNQFGGTAHTLLSSETYASLFAGAQSYANNVTVTADSEIAISNTLAANIGVLSIGAQTLTVSSPNVQPFAYSLTAASTTLTGNATFNVLNSAGGTGTFAPNVITGGASSITKNGNGTLLLDKDNAYSGGTTVNAGTLLVSNPTGSATGSGTVLVQTAGKLTGAGRIGGGVSIQSGGTFTPGAGVGTALTIGGNVTIGTGVTSNYVLGTTGVNNTANITLGLTVSGAQTLNLNESNGLAPGSSYVLATALGGVTNTATYTFNETGVTYGLPGITPSVSVVGNQLILTGTNQSIVWAGNVGAGGDQWNNANLGNWTVANPFLDGYSVTFDDTGIARPSVVIGTLVRPWTTTFNNSSGNDYTVTGVIGGPGGITKTNTGGVTLITANTYTGNTTITGGYVLISADSNLGAAPASATAGKIVLNGGTLGIGATLTLNANRGIAVGNSVGTIFVDDTYTATYGGVIANVPAETGVLKKIGLGTLVLTAVNTFTGGIVVDEGTLASTTGINNTALSTGPVTVNAGATLRSDAFDSFGYNGGNPSVININGGTVTTGGNGGVGRFERMRIVRHTPAPDPTDTLSFGSTSDTPDEPDTPPLPLPALP